jgi:quercetin dioxygenase-like cupin family protein
VQRGTVHAWENETDEWVRMFVVLVAAKEEPE